MEVVPYEGLPDQVVQPGECASEHGHGEKYPVVLAKVISLSGLLMRLAQVLSLTLAFPSFAATAGRLPLAYCGE